MRGSFNVGYMILFLKIRMRRSALSIQQSGGRDNRGRVGLCVRSELEIIGILLLVIITRFFSR